VNDPLSHGGDGLGPMFNATSCAACHNQGGVGGSGSLEHNADMLVLLKLNHNKTLSSVVEDESLVGRDVKARNQRTNSEQGILAQVVPAFATAVSAPVHRFGPSADYEDYRTGLLVLRGDGPLKSAGR